jgi:hypothetical protein
MGLCNYEWNQINTSAPTFVGPVQTFLLPSSVTEFSTHFSSRKEGQQLTLRPLTLGNFPSYGGESYVHETNKRVSGTAGSTPPSPHFPLSHKTLY